MVFTHLKLPVILKFVLHELANLTEKVITLQTLIDANIVSRETKKAKVIKSGELNKAIFLKGVRVTLGARKVIETAGGRGRPSVMVASISGMGRFGKLGQSAELRSRLFFVLFALVIFRIGSHITIPGVDPYAMASIFDQQRGGILDMFNMFGGGALERMSIFALGVMPYISASIIMQLMTHVIPSLEQLRKEGETGRKKITQYTRYGTLLLATVQAIGMCTLLKGQSVASTPVVYIAGMGFMVIATITLVTGTIFLMWLGEQITERGVGNGISIIIFAGIVSGLPSAVGGTLELARTGELSSFVVIVLLFMVFAVTSFVIFVERGQRRITVNYAKRQQGRKNVCGTA